MNYSLYRTRFDQSKYPGRKEFYYGVRKNLCSNYTGSGTRISRLVEKYGREAFVVDVIKDGLSKDEAYELEAFIVDNNMLENPDCINLIPGGREGGWDYVNKTGKNIGWSYVNDNGLSGSGMTGLNHTEETKQYLSNLFKGRSAPWVSDALKGRPFKTRKAKWAQADFLGVKYSEVNDLLITKNDYKLN